MTRPVPPPTYVYDVAALDRHAAAIRAALPPEVRLLYAMKANPATELLRALAPHVDGFEAASRGELRHLADALPGVPPAAFGGPGKTDADLAAGLAAGVRRFHVESGYELRRLSTLATAYGVVADVLLRVNLPAPTSGAVLVMGGRPSPFGMDPTDARSCLSLDLPGVRVRGVHAHLASGLPAAQAAEIAGRIVRWAVTELAATEVNVGGGMAVDYTDPTRLFDWPEYGRGLAAVRKEHPDMVLSIEPGRAVSAYCGWYVTEVIDVKRCGGEWFAVVAGGTHHLRTPAAKGHSQPFTVTHRPTWDSPLPRPRAGAGPVTLVGQLCTPKDVLARCAGPLDIAVGDIVTFGMAGAYAWNISHHGFLMHEPPVFRIGDPQQVVQELMSTGRVSGSVGAQGG